MLAHDIARRMQRFRDVSHPLDFYNFLRLNSHRRCRQSKSKETDPRWTLGGRDDIQFEELVLVSLRHVSLGCWQLQFRLYPSLEHPSPMAYIESRIHPPAQIEHIYHN